VTSNLSEIHTVDDLLCSSDPNLIQMSSGSFFG
jgi:hypothetical protein